MSLTVSASGITFNDLTTFSTGILSTVNIANNSITTAKIVPGAVVTEDLADSAVTTSKISLSAVTANRINLVTSLSSNGYQIMAGGLIMQWGQVTSNGSEGTYSVTFPIAFPNACLQIIPGLNLNTWSNPQGMNTVTQVSSFTTTGAVFYLQAADPISGSGTILLTYLAIGF